jgi:hypothetical protein
MADSGSLAGFARKTAMNTGKPLFAQLMDFLPWTTFARYVARYDGDKGMRALTCAEQFRVMAFAQLTYRESLRDIEVCLSAQKDKLYHMGFRQPIRRSTLADANHSRDWRIHADFAQRLIAQARALYANEDWGLELSNTVAVHPSGVSGSLAQKILDRLLVRIQPVHAVMPASSMCRAKIGESPYRAFCMNARALPPWSWVASRQCGVTIR